MFRPARTRAEAAAVVRRYLSRNRLWPPAFRQALEVLLAEPAQDDTAAGDGGSQRSGRNL